MKLRNQLPISRLVGKIDNDFNLGDSDWIPRVAAWTIDALEQLNVCPKHRVRRILMVDGHIATLPEIVGIRELKVFDMRGCEIPLAKNARVCNCDNSSQLGGEIYVRTADTLHGGIQTSEHITVYDVDGNEIDYSEIAGIYYTRDIYNNRYIIGRMPCGCEERNFVFECHSIDLNFETDKIMVETLEVATYYDEYYQDCVPYIYDNGLLLEALAWYCLFKHLSRGVKHPVYSLSSPSPVLNPYSQWNNLKDKAKASVKNAISITDEKGWNSFFYNSTFRPRD